MGNWKFRRSALPVNSKLGRLLMADQNDTGRIGTFRFSQSREVMGSLVLSDRDTHLRLFSDEDFPHSVPDHICGLLHDGTRVTLVNCILTQIRNHHRDGRSRSEAEVFPHFVLEGAVDMDPGTPCVTSISLFIEDATSLFYDFDAFGSALDAAPIMAAIAARDTRGRPLPVGPDPQVAYFAGQRQLASVATSLGTVRADHCPGLPFGGPRGVAINNEVCIQVEFADPVDFHESFRRVSRVLSLLELLIGRQQVIRRQYVFTQQKSLRVHWSHAPRRKLDRHDQDRSPQPADILVMAADQREEFACILKQWVESDGARKHARQRFHSLFVKGHRFNVDRLVAAANVFDIFPSSGAPSQSPLTPELEQARATARAAFKSLPPSYERDSVLNALGRVGKPSLKHKVRARVNTLLAMAPLRFSELQAVVELAVDCRNYFVHGTPIAIDGDAIHQLLPFLTETLEFVFACSDLVDCGWRFDQFVQRGTTMSHPFGGYKVNYRNNIDAMRQITAQATRRRAEDPGD